ncbi:MAG: hypothetical protein ABWY25_07690 [Paenisporosarcina sp.]
MVNKKIHTIPVPYGWSPEQAWEATQRGDELPEEGERWVNVETDDHNKFIRILPEK